MILSELRVKEVYGGIAINHSSRRWFKVLKIYKKPRKPEPDWDEDGTIVGKFQDIKTKEIYPMYESDVIRLVSLDEKFYD